MSLISDNIKRVRDRVHAACAKVSRSPDDISIVAVTKTVPVPAIQEAVVAGIDTIGENRVQEAAAKKDLVDSDVSWHMVGHLQRNKAKKAVSIFNMIESVDSFELASEIDRRSAQAGKTMDILVEVNTSSEETKFGTAPEAAVELIERISHLGNVRVRGLMTIGAFTDDEEVVRGCFRTLRKMGESLAASRIDNVDADFLSMGMTSDFELAIEEGSNMVRIGTAIFGTR